jgi:uncharacterized RDD family membrane protein YckC
LERFDDILDVGEEYPRQLQYADFGSRLAAYIIDSLILSVFLFMLFIFLGFVEKSDVFRDPDYFNGMVGLMIILGGPAIFLAYHAVFESSKYGGSPGKILVRIKVTDLYGSPIEFWHAVGRNAGKFLSQLAIYIGFIMALWTPRKQTLHDLMANTLVVRKEHPVDDIQRSSETV